MKHLINEALWWAESTLNTAHIDTAMLLAFVFNQDRAWLYAHSEISLSERQWKKFQKLIERRQRREPVAYLTGHQEFYGLDFLVNKNVLIPRPETELIIDYLKDKLLVNTRPLIVDVGTGSGVLAITAAKVWPGARVVAIDNSAAALKVARANARRHGVGKQIKFFKGDLLHPLYKGHPLRVPLKGCPLYLLANLPYLSVSTWRQTQPEVRLYEPRHALLGGRDGLKFYRELIKQLASTRAPLVTQGAPLLTVLLEIDPHQSKPLSKIIKKALPSASIEIKKDLAGLERLLIMRL